MDVMAILGYESRPSGPTWSTPVRDWNTANGQGSKAWRESLDALNADGVCVAEFEIVLRAYKAA